MTTSSQKNDSLALVWSPVKEVEIAFVKTHKTGSTTMGALLYRYALRHGLKVCMCSSCSITRSARISCFRRIVLTLQWDPSWSAGREFLDAGRNVLTPIDQVGSSRQAGSWFNGRNPERVVFSSLLPVHLSLNVYSPFSQPCRISMPSSFYDMT